MAKKPKKLAKKSAKKKPAAKAAPKKSVKKVAKKPVAKKAAAPKPSGSTLLSVAPGFTVSDATASVAWYQNVLGFKLAERWENDGQFQGGSMRLGNVTINIGQDDWKMGRDRIKGQGTRMYIMMGPKIDKYADQIKARGGTLDHDPQDGWGMRVFGITDPDGYKLTFMTNAKK